MTYKGWYALKPNQPTNQTTNKDLGPQSLRSRGLWHFCDSVCVCDVWISWELRENPTQRLKMLTYQVIVFHFSSAPHFKLHCTVSLTSLSRVFFLTDRSCVFERDR